MALAATTASWLLLAVALGVALGVGSLRAPTSTLWLACTVLSVLGGLMLASLACALLLRLARGWSRLVLAPWLLAVLIGVYSLSIALAAVHPVHPRASVEAPPGAIRVDMTAADRRLAAPGAR